MRLSEVARSALFLAVGRWRGRTWLGWVVNVGRGREVRNGGALVKSEGGRGRGLRRVVGGSEGGGLSGGCKLRFYGRIGLYRYSTCGKILSILSLYE